jgi:hypothetical protein
MIINFLGHSLFTLLFSLQTLHALECPSKADVPLCPTSGTTLLDETYPTQAFVISNLGFEKTKESAQVPQNFVDKIIKSYEYKNIPQIIISVENVKDFETIVSKAREDLRKKNISIVDTETILKQISFLKTPSYAWQQDWFESFVDLNTGAPLIKQIASYSPITFNTDRKLANISEQCNVKNGPPLISDYPDPLDDSDPRENQRSFGSAEAGGNIEGAPGGFCMIGDNAGREFVKQVCGERSNTIQLDTSWLAVGHVDEIFKIIPTHYNDGRPKECEFSLMAASPKKSFELMSTSRDLPFMNLDLSDKNVDEMEFRNTRSDTNYRNNLKICSYIKNIVDKNPRDQELKSATRNVFIKLFLNMSSAHAKNVVNSLFPKKDRELESLCKANIDRVSNLDISNMIKEDKDTYDLNMAIDDSIQQDKALIKLKILSRLPQCTKYFNIIDVPNIFYGDKLVKNPAKGKFELPRPGTIESFLPNPTNSVLMNKTVTFSDTGNFIFNQYLTDELKKRKMKSDFISTWDYSHLAMGNIHCVSHSLTHCRPHPKQGSK